MAKRAKKSSRYQSFKLHGSHPIQTVIMYVLFDLFIAATLRFFFQPVIASFVTAYAASSFF